MKLRVAVLYGGRSGEHEISLRSVVAAQIEGSLAIRLIMHILSGEERAKILDVRRGLGDHIDIVCEEDFQHNSYPAVDAELMQIEVE